MMQDLDWNSTCFSYGDRFTDDPAAVTRSVRVYSCLYTKQKSQADQCRLTTITWLARIYGENHYSCKVEVKPWYFWRKQGSKGFQVDGEAQNSMGKLNHCQIFYVAIVCQDEVVLLLGDQKKDAYRKTEKFTTRAKFLEKGKSHEISVECNNNNNFGGFDPEMEIRIDGILAHVKHLHWKFRGNESIFVSKVRSGLRHALFVFKPISSLSTSPSSILSTSTSSSSSTPSMTSTPLSSYHQTEGYNGKWVIS
ncbi:hypothetical protein MKW92_010533 [Papaver armeniacum]|nr:hypothetical protein MKW92_010533 [Papaver armeniacum]